MINIYTDGSSRGNPGPGGYGTILISGSHHKTISQGFRKTTNNRMELLAVIVGLEALKHANSKVQVTSDSKYVVDAINKNWLINWKKKNFKNIKNPDLWKRFFEIYQQHQVTFCWIKGHNQHPENEQCDKLATQAADNQSLWHIDTWYEENAS